MDAAHVSSWPETDNAIGAYENAGSFVNGTSDRCDDTVDAEFRHVIRSESTSLF